MTDRSAAPSLALAKDYRAPALSDLLAADRHGWIGVDLDGTLAHYNGWRGDDCIGAPIPAMVNLVRRLLREGCEVRIVTARVDHLHSPEEIELNRGRISVWTLTHIGTALQATAAKDRRMTALYDDRAVRVASNRGAVAEAESVSESEVDEASMCLGGSAAHCEVSRDTLRRLLTEFVQRRARS